MQTLIRFTRYRHDDTEPTVTNFGNDSLESHYKQMVLELEEGGFYLPLTFVKAEDGRTAPGIHKEAIIFFAAVDAGPDLGYVTVPLQDAYDRGASGFFEVIAELVTITTTPADPAEGWLTTYCARNYGGDEGQDGKGFTAGDLADAYAAGGGTFDGASAWVASYCERNYKDAEGQNDAGFTADDMRVAYMAGQPIDPFSVLRARQDVAKIVDLGDGRFDVVDDVGANKVGTFTEVVEWLDAGLADADELAKAGEEPFV